MILWNIQMNSLVDQMAKDVTTFLSWSAEPELEERQNRCKSNNLFNSFNYFSLFKKKIWSRVDMEV